MNLNPFKRKQLVPAIVEPDAKIENLVSLMELAGNPGLISQMEAAYKNMVDSASFFQSFEDASDTGNYFSTEHNIRATAGRIKGMYAKEPWVFAAATIIARTLALVPFQVQDIATGEILDNHPLQAKINGGNKFQDPFTLNWVGYLDLILGGNFFRVFDEFYNEAMQVPVELVTLQMDYAKREIESLRIWDNNLGRYNRTVPYKQCVHMKLPNPYNPFYGLSWFIAASRPLLLDRAKQEFEMSFYLRGATSSGVIESTEDMSKTRMERLMRTFESIYTGKRNWWRTIFLPKGSKWVKSSLTMAEMQHLEGMRENRLTLLAVLGIPPSKVGIVQDVNRSTAEIQDETFWENTIQPLAEFVAGSWNGSYLVRTIYSGRVKVVPDFSGIEALNGSMLSKGEQAKAVESYLTVNEIREDILGYPPLADDRGNKLVIEIRATSAPAAPQLALSAADPVAEVTDALSDVTALTMKAAATTSQSRIEQKLGTSFIRGYQRYIDLLLTYAKYALEHGENVATYLKTKQRELAKVYVDAVEDDLVAALERGFTFANAQSKSLSAGFVRTKGRVKTVRFREVDQEAIDVLREKQRDGRRETLVKRSIENFVGFNDTDSQRILDIVADGLSDGKTTDQIAADIRSDYTEQYSGQSSTVARTEILSAVSEGIKWNHDVLGEVFSDVQKQWFHVGDGASNAHARQNHVDFEGEGAVPSDYKWGGVLAYPRDPNGGAEEVINCRCTMVSVVPDGASSNAEVILDQV